jgi:hypothetical protein
MFEFIHRSVKLKFWNFSEINIRAKNESNSFLNKSNLKNEHYLKYQIKLLNAKNERNYSTKVVILIL